MAIVGVVIVFRIPDKYEATARIYVDTQSILKPLMAGLAVQPNVEQQVVMLSRTLISRPNIEKLVRMADLDLKSESKAEQEALITSLMATLQIKNAGRDNLYTLSYRDADPEKAQQVIQSLVSIFVESSLGASRKDTDIGQGLPRRADQELRGQARGSRGPAEGVPAAQHRDADGRRQGLGVAAGRIGRAAEAGPAGTARGREGPRRRRAAARRRRSRQARAVADARACCRSRRSASPRRKSTRGIEAQKRNLDGLLQRFTEQHPDVVSARRLIKDLEEQKRKEVAGTARRRHGGAAARCAGAGAGQPGLPGAEPDAGDLRGPGGLAARPGGRVQARYNGARESLKTAPQIEAEAAQLNRDYAHPQEELRGPGRAARVGGDVGRTGSGLGRGRLPPDRSAARVAQPGVAEPPAAVAAGASWLALGAGLFVAFAGSQLRPVFHGASELRGKIGLPLLGVVSMVDERRRARRERGRA